MTHNRPLTPRRRLGLLLVLATLLTLLNACKPLHMDDAAYCCYARQIARAPLDPYGFEIFWYQQPQPAHQVLAPPVLPYWWAGAICLFGERPFCWKLWLWPFSFLLVTALDRLFRRFAEGFQTPLVWLAVLSPAVLPSFNLMLDVPALALSLFALSTFLSACDRESAAGVVLAGLTAGVAVQTKYTALLAPASMLLYSCLARRIRPGLLAAAASGLVFVAWECLTAWLYGESHFLYHLRGNGKTILANLTMLRSLAMILGGVAPAQLLLGLLALRAWRGVVVLVGGWVVVGVVLLAWGGEPLTWDVPLLSFETIRVHCSRERIVFEILGWVLCILLVRTAYKLCWRSDPDGSWKRDDYFLVLWLALEVAGACVLSPFPAVRRALGIAVVSLLLVGRLASRTCRTEGEKRWVYGVSAAGIALGLGFYAVDLEGARAQRRAVEAVVVQARQEQPRKVWYTGHWGFQYYAERRHMTAVVPGVSRLRAGDWLVIPDTVDRQAVQLGAREVDLLDRLCVGGTFPLRTVSGYYGSCAPLECRQGPCLSVAVYAVRTDFVPAERGKGR